MKLQLFLENNLIELNGNETFSLNKTFDDLSNPTNIIVDYSKSINIPITTHNNKILSNLYRLDKEIVKGSSNIGLYLDPNNRIPMRLTYNNDVVIEGYAKYISSTVTSTGGFYTLNLFGAMGDIFYKLRGLTTSYSTLTDDQKSDENGWDQYVLNDYSEGEEGEPITLTSSFAYDSFLNSDPSTANPGDEVHPAISGIFGVAPTYRGLYPNFESKEIQTSESEVMTIEEYLRQTWINNYYEQNNILIPDDNDRAAAEAYVDSLNTGDIVGDGLKDYQLDEYRSYQLRPFVYFNKLMYMYINKLSAISDYSISLDETWFNDYNPYWTRLCYMFDFLIKRGQSISGEELYTENLTFETSSYNSLTTPYTTYGASGSITNSIGSQVSSPLIIKPFQLAMNLVTAYRVGYLINIDQPQGLDIITPTVIPSEITLNSDNLLKISLTFGSDTHIFYASTLPYDVASQRFSSFNISQDSFLSLHVGNCPSIPQISHNPTNTSWVGYVNIPQLTSDGSGLDEMVVDVELITGGAIGSVPQSYQPYCAYFSVMNRGRFIRNIDIYNDITTFVPATLSFHVSPLYQTEPPYYNTVSLESFYKREEPLFDVILQYTKMFGLIWDIDYRDKVVKIMRRETYFSDYEITPWDDKVDKSKDITIEPVAFPTKYIKFGYEPIDGFTYSSYTDKYGAQYGDKIVRTPYSFNSDTSTMITGINPGLMCNRSFVTLNDLTSWNLTGMVTPIVDPLTRLECANEDDSASINACPWCFRGDNISHTCYLTDDTSLMITNNKSFYIDPKALDNGSITTTFVKSTTFPTYTMVYNDNNNIYSCLFNTPNLDYTTANDFSQAQGRTIYDLFWNDYINERYNAQNKKLTAYFYLTGVDYNNFKFNKFVTFDNQLFMVNKIIDFDVTSNKPTKCELIQISNINNYTIPKITFE